MLDFVTPSVKTLKGRNGEFVEVEPLFALIESKDLMVRGGEFHSVWDADASTWSRSQYRLVDLVDGVIRDHISTLPEAERDTARQKRMRFSNSGVYATFEKHCKSIGNHFKPLNQRVLFASDLFGRDDHATFRLSYDRAEGSIDHYQTLMSTVYDPDELEKLEWAVGAIFTGASKWIQKFIVIYGPPASGKSTYIRLLELLFEGYATSFNAASLGRSADKFAASAFADDPLLAFEHDGDLSRIDDNTRLNSIVSHERIKVEEKFKKPVEVRAQSFLVMGTNNPVKITDSESGLLRRLIDVHSSGRTLSPAQYYRNWEGLTFELGAIADHCIKVYQSLGPSYYDNYRPLQMMYRTNEVYGFVDAYSYEFSKVEWIQLRQVYSWYKKYCDDGGIQPLPRTKFRDQLRPYFRKFEQRTEIKDFGEQLRSVFIGFKPESLMLDTQPKKGAKLEDMASWLQFDGVASEVDHILKDRPAQYANDYGSPNRKWADIDTTLKDLNTSEVHYVQPPLDHIVIDFDLTDTDGNKSLAMNVEAASKWPPTYAETSKSGQGVHLHYLYSGDPTRLSRIFAPSIEIKVFVGNASLRRKLSQFNSIPVTTLSSGLPIKETKMLNVKEVQSEIGLRRLVEKNLHKLIHPGTKPSIDFIHKILTDAYNSDLVYDLEDMKPRVISFAANSTNQFDYCMRLVGDMPFKSKQKPSWDISADDERLAFFDVEVFPNLFVVCWKFEGSENVVRMINPTSAEIGDLLNLNLVGFNNRRYDNHILYARYMGYTNAQLFQLSQSLIKKERSPFGMAYGLSYTDIWDFNSNKQSLKRWQIELGMVHMELGFPWDVDVPEESWDKVAEYCENDVRSTEKLFHNRKGDWTARQILSELSGMSVNTPTNTHSAYIVFGSTKPVKSEFVYTDLSTIFPGYKYEFGKSEYKGRNPSEGGYVNERTGMYTDVAVLDVTSMHPTSIINLNLFGNEYTARYAELLEARVAIKHGDISKLEKILGGKLSKYVSEGSLSPLSYALKIVLNSVYGLTSASFDNPFRDERNVDNIVAKRGALFMIDLNDFVETLGLQVVHTKTDSIKVPDASDGDILKIQEFARSYGYEMEHEETYSKFALVNKSTYVGRNSEGKWDAVGIEFQRPYVYKTIFSGEPIGFEDLVETKEVKTSIWITDGVDDKYPHFVGRVGTFVPVIDGGGHLLRKGDESYSHVAGTKGYMWKEAPVEKELSNGKFDNIDMRYFDKLVNDAYDHLREFGDVEWLLHE